ncbi:MAG: small ribosomal subunit Rsm22 family protein [Bdellovibrionales bacterium]
MSQKNLVKTESRQFSLPDYFPSLIEPQLLALGYSLEKPKPLADAIKQLSDFFIENPKKATPWHQKWAQAAYLAYFFPLNWLRAEAVLREGNRFNFFEGMKSYLDFGSGLGAYSFLLAEMGLSKGVCIDHSVDALHLHEDLMKRFSKPTSIRWYEAFNGVVDSNTEVGIFSYVFTELEKLPKWCLRMESLVIVEPSTRDDGRHLMELREFFMDEGYSVWAPCLHQLECPLLEHSKKDWCHDRIFFNQPEWFQKIEAFLPMKNKTITFSYLLLRKTEPPFPADSAARVVGDLLDENGKYRQMICRAEHREFLSWLKKDFTEEPTSKRGEIIDIPMDVQNVSNELRYPPPKKH